LHVSKPPVTVKDRDEVVITRDDLTTANAGPDQTVCATSATLAANTPATGTGTWSVISGAGTFTSANSPTSPVTGLSLGANTFRWTLTNGVCADSQDEVVITRDDLTTANAGSDQTVCATSATLAANTPATGSGTWTVVSGSGTFTNANSPTSTVTGLGLGANTFRWTLLNGVCTDSQDDVVITRDDLTTANAGPDQTVCATSATLAANTPATGTGTWTVVSGTGTFTNANSPTSTVTGLSLGANTFRWTLPNGVCTDSQDDVIITRDDLTTANAGPDQTVCATSATLAANTPATGTGTWSVVSGTGTFTNANSPTSPVTGLGLGANTFRWTLPNGVCADSQDDVVVSRNDPSIAPTGISGVSTICDGSSTTLTVTGGTLGTGAAIQWFTGSCGGISAGTGNSITVSPASNTTYYVRYSGDCNTTTCASLLITVNSLHTLSLTSGSPTQTVCENAAIGNIVYAVGGGATSANVSGLPSGVTGMFSSGNFTISGTPSVSGVFNYTVTTSGNSCPVITSSGTITVISPIDYANLQFPNTASICSNGSLLVYGQVYEPGITEPAGVGTGLSAQIGYHTSNTNPNTWTNWSPASFNVQVGNNDEFTGTLSGLSPGTYFYTFRYSLNGCPYQYGGYPNGFWNGTTQTSGTLTVFGTIITSGAFGGSASLTQCVGGNPSSFNVGAPSGGNGSYTYQWEQSSGCTGTWINATAEDGNATSLSFNPPALNSVGSMCYRLKITDGCNSIAYSNTKSYTVVSDPVSQTIVPTLVSGSTLCLGEDVSATFTGGTGGTGTVVDVYEFSTNGGGVWNSYTPGTTITATLSMLGSNTIQIRTRRTATGTGCGDGIYNIVSYSVNQLDYFNLQHPSNATICASTGVLTIYGQVYEPGVTPGAGLQGANIVAELGYHTANTNPNTWTNWQPANFNPAGGGTNNDEYLFNLTGLTGGTYYYTYRYKINSCPYQYGGYSSGGGGTWDGITNVSGELTVLNQVNFGTIINGNESICLGDDPSDITLTSLPSGGQNSFSYQWYYQDGIVTCPTGTNTSGWTIIPGANSNSYTPPSELTVSRTYALMVDPTGSPDCGLPTWASGCRQVTVIVCCIAPTSLTYSTNPVNYCSGFPITNNLATVNGTSPHTFTVSPTLPNGLTLNTGNGTISGTPNTPTAASNYLITATNACGFTTTTLNLAVTAPDCTIIGNNGPVCPVSSQVYTAPSGMSSYLWSVSGNAIISGAANNSSVNVVAGNICNDSFTINLTVTDSNGCTSACSKTVNVADSVAPVFTACPASSLILGCNPAAINSLQAISDAGAVTDNCNSPALTATGATVNNTGCNYSQIWTVTATDACNNSSNCSITYSWNQDAVKPVITTANSNQNLGCNPTITPPLFSGTDNCEGSILPVVTTSGASNTGCMFSQSWTANYTDACGNVADAVTITYTWTIDGTPPTAGNPAPITLSGCNGSFPAPDITMVTDEADNCLGPITVAFAGDGTPSLSGCTETTVRTYSVTDVCGKSITVSQNLIRTIDTTPPSFTYPAPVSQTADTGSCEASVVITAPVATDNCGTPAMAGVRSDLASLNDVYPVGTVVITWTATDNCGNSSTCNQSVLITDNEIPVLSNCPSDIVACENTSTISYTLPSASDNCSGAVVNQISGLTSGAIFPVGITTNTFRTVDLAGNSSAPCSFNVTILENPTGGSIDLTEFCSGASAVATINGVSLATQYLWNLPPSLSGSSTSNSITLSGTIAGSYNITVTPQNVSGSTVCNGTPVTGTVIVHPIPTVAITNNDPVICTGGVTDIVLSNSPANITGTLFNWTRDISTVVTGTNSANGVSGPIAIALSHSETTEQAVNFTITPVANGCPGDAAQTLVTVKPELTVETQPVNVTVCAGNGAVLNVAVSGGAGNITYQWQYFGGLTWDNVVNGTPGGAVYTNQNTAMVNVGNITSAGVHQFRCVIAASGEGCESVVSNPATVTINTNPTPAFLTPALSVCTNSDHTYTLNSVYSNYIWTINGGTVTGGGGINDNFVSVHWGLAGSGSVSVTVADGNSCTGIVSENITINSRPSVTYCQNPDYCQINEGSVLLNIQGGALPYTLSWTPNHGLPNPPVIINSAGNFTISGLHGNTDYIFILTDNNGCSP